MGCTRGAICFRPDSSYATVPAWRSFASCSTPIGPPAGSTRVRRAAYGYLALSLDKLLNYNSRMSVWMPTREVVANTFNPPRLRVLLVAC